MVAIWQAMESYQLTGKKLPPSESDGGRGKTLSESDRVYR